VIAVNHLPYTFALAFIDLAFAGLFGYLILLYFKKMSGGISLGELHDELGQKLKVSASIRLLVVNMIMVVTAISGFWQYTAFGTFILNLTACFKFNFGTFFCIDMIFLHKKR
jgi:hypothetical protein